MICIYRAKIPYEYVQVGCTKKCMEICKTGGGGAVCPPPVFPLAP